MNRHERAIEMVQLYLQEYEDGIREDWEVMGLLDLIVDTWLREGRMEVEQAKEEGM